MKNEPYVNQNCIFLKQKKRKKKKEAEPLPRTITPFASRNIRQNEIEKRK
jgi:hypothetical protein